MNTTDLKPMPPNPGLEYFQQEAANFIQSFKSGNAVALQSIKTYHPQGQESDIANLLEVFNLYDSKSVVAREYGFETWQKLAAFIDAFHQGNSLVAPFESAADSIVNGDAHTLHILLQENQELIRARSLRAHRATLLHYVSANGFENYRQKTPQNIISITKLLLEAGAEVDAAADMYGGNATTLGLAATSVHPFKAGVQHDLLTILIEAGANVNGLEGGWSPLISALHNGRLEAALFLADRGAMLDLEGAAGVGKLDVVKSFFKEDGSLKANATRKQMQEGFSWACSNGYNNVVEFLLNRGVDMQSTAYTGLTGLHWAIVGNQLDTIKLLLKYDTSLEVENIYGGRALGQALWCVVNNESGIDYMPVIELLLEAGAKIETGTLAWLEKQDFPSNTAKIRLLELFRRYGAPS